LLTDIRLWRRLHGEVFLQDFRHYLVKIRVGGCHPLWPVGELHQCVVLAWLGSPVQEQAVWALAVPGLQNMGVGAELALVADEQSRRVHGSRCGLEVEQFETTGASQQEIDFAS